MTCEQQVTPLSSCTVAWADPATTLPKGRLQAHIRLHETGGLEATCPIDDCDNCGRGLSVCIRNEDVCDDLESPPECLNSDGTDRFKNALRRDVKGKLWVDVRRIFAGLTPTVETITPSAGVAPASGGHAMQSGSTSFTNDSCFPMKVKVEACIKGALIGGPEPTGQGTVSGDVTGTSDLTSGAVTGDVSIPCSDIADCRTPAVVIYELTVDGETCEVFSSSGDWDHYSGTVCVGVVDVPAGGTISNAITTQLRYQADARDAFPVSSGELTICYTPSLDISNEDC